MNVNARTRSSRRGGPQEAGPSNGRGDPNARGSRETPADVIERRQARHAPLGETR